MTEKVCRPQRTQIPKAVSKQGSEVNLSEEDRPRRHDQCSADPDENDDRERHLASHTELKHATYRQVSVSTTS